MAVATRKIGFSYNGVSVPGTIGGATVTLHAVHGLSVSREEFSADFTLLVKAGLNGLASAVSTIHSTFTAPDKAFTVTITETSGVTLFSADPSDRSALYTRGEVDKEGDPVDTARSQLLRVTITGELPYPTDQAAGRKALRELEWSLAYDAARIATLSISGTYTATTESGGTSASAQHDAQISALFTELTTAAGGTWPAVGQPLTERRTYDRLDAVHRFEREYRELIFGESASSPLDDADIGDFSLVIRRRTPSVESTPDVIAFSPQTLVAEVTAVVDKTRTTDLRGKWDNSLRAWALSNIDATLVEGTLRYVDESVDFAWRENTITATLEFEGVPVSGAFVQFSVVTTVNVRFGVLVADVWPEGNPLKLQDTEPTEAYATFGPKNVTRTIESTFTIVGDDPAPAIKTPSQLVQFPELLTKDPNGTGRKVIPEEVDSRYQRRVVGSTADGGGEVTLTDRVVVERIRIFKGIAA